MVQCLRSDIIIIPFLLGRLRKPLLRHVLQPGIAEGQRLGNVVILLKRMPGFDALQQAAQAAAQGDPAEMMQMMNRIMQSSDGAALVERIRKAMQK